jgi:membrane glycosyltransferase
MTPGHPRNPSPETLLWHRTLFIFPVLSIAVGGLLLFSQHGADMLPAALRPMTIALFGVLLLQIGTGCVLAVLGFWQKWKGSAWDICQNLPASPAPGVPLPATAIIIPIFNEDMDRVAAGLKSVWKSLAETGCLESFDFYLLSDSTRPECWIREETAWWNLLRELGGTGRLFYRKRRRPLNKKSGNIADFCRRWGNHYRYMIVLDSDSLMTGSLLVRLVAAMEANPRTGLIQTFPKMVFGRTLLRRILQFSLRLCGPLFGAGCHYWQMNGANYWGHNAIIRVAAFMRHCALPDLPVKNPSDRKILSHDIVEAALMRRAGYDLWLAPFEEGSFEEGPPTLNDLLVRDRRWCKGNLQHFWFLFARGLRFESRLHIAFGIMAYLGSPLWLFFLLLSALDAYLREIALVSVLPPNGYTPVVLLWGLTLTLLFIPKILGLLMELPAACRYGGKIRLAASACIEIVFSALMAPILMAYHSLFVFQCLSGRGEKWNSQNRRDRDLTWTESFRAHAWLSLTGLVAALLLWHFVPNDFLWFFPVCLSWILAIPFAKWTSSLRAGNWTRARGIFCIPEEITPPPEFQDVLPGQKPPQPPNGNFASLILHPFLMELHVTVLRQSGQKEHALSRQVEKLRLQALTRGPAHLSTAQQYQLLWDLSAVLQMHRALWKTPFAALPEEWKQEFRNLSLPTTCP